MSNGYHSNPVWSTFIFVICMLLFLFYLESMINPMDFLVSKSFVQREYYQIGHKYHGYLPLNQSKFITYEEILNGSFDLNRHGNTLVSLHIQKTSGKAFGTHIVLDINSNTGPVCNCTGVGADDNLIDLLPGSCSCDLDGSGASPWFFNRLTVGWPCGVHAGWTELSLNCLDKSLNYKRKYARRYAKITFLSDPLPRYLREWRQVATHGQWPIEHLHCHPLRGTNYFNGNWSDVMLDSFLRCGDNPANNRQVRMLANLTLVPCDDVRDALTRNRHTINAEPDHVKNISDILLESAKENLIQIPFFGLMEFPSESDRLFEYTFGIRFSKPFTGVELSDNLSSVKTTAHQRDTISEYNQLDRKLYEFAKKLFFERLEKMAIIYSKITRPIVLH